MKKILCLNPDAHTEYFEISIDNTNIILLIFYNITSILWFKIKIQNHNYFVRPCASMLECFVLIWSISCALLFINVVSLLQLFRIRLINVCPVVINQRIPWIASVMLTKSYNMHLNLNSKTFYITIFSIVFLIYYQFKLLFRSNIISINHKWFIIL